MFGNDLGKQGKIITPPGAASDPTGDVTAPIADDEQDVSYMAAPAVSTTDDDDALAASSSDHVSAPPAPAVTVVEDEAEDEAPSPDTQAPTAPDDLLSIKKEALQQLSPLVDQLEQTSEEKFRTTMMMIQASDDQTLVKAAYEAAKGISDEKVRAQALLDIVNEINYFTQANNDK